MNYQVLARKWRPHNFSEVVGQEHVVKSLINALQHNRLHHAYLFTGTRGVGKTTLARILAKAINCENLQGFNPCGACAVCLALDEGRFLDLIEVDAASRTKVEDTRDLLDNAQYAPNQGRYKVYLIDEVHMLSGHSFNALLKTLEEPPPHVKFLLATTDPHKIPITVLSRCLQFSLKPLQPSQIFTQMGYILGQENIAFESTALKTIARAADGSMRDALSLLDQAIVYGNGQVNTQEVHAMLGTMAQQPVEDILSALADGDAAALLDGIDATANTQTDFAEVLDQLLRMLHRIALVQHLPNLVDPEFDSETLAQLAVKFSPEDVQLYYQIGLLGQRDLPLAPDPRSGFEMVMLRMLTFRPEVPAKTATPVVTPRPSQHQTVRNEVAETQPKLQPPQSYPTSPPTSEKVIAEVSSTQPETAVPSAWTEMIKAMKLESLTKELANNCRLESLDEQSCTLLLDVAHQSLLTAKRVEKLQTALRHFSGKPLKLLINNDKTVADTPAAQLTKQREDRQQAAVDAINADPNVTALKERFDARIIQGSIEPVETNEKERP
jgi:DNA polymerase-3 subunit gamma/tau